MRGTILEFMNSKMNILEFMNSKMFFWGPKKSGFGWLQTFQEHHMKHKNHENKSSPDDVDSTTYFSWILCTNWNRPYQSRGT